MDAVESFSFEGEWPDTSAKLEAALRRRRIPECLIDDLVQETALRLFLKWVYVDPVRGTWPLALTVAMNILRDNLRVEARRNAAPPPTVQAEHDPEVVALARIELERVREALWELSPAQRAALLAEVGESNGDERSSSAVKMLRMRARKRLRAITKESPAIASIELFIQRLLGNADSAPAISAGVAAFAPVTAGLIAITLFSAPSSVQASESSPLQSRARTHLTTEAIVERGFLTIAGYEVPTSRADELSAVRIELLAHGLPLPGAPAEAPVAEEVDTDEGRRSRKSKGGYDGDTNDLPTDLGIPPPPNPDPPKLTVKESDADAGADGAEAVADVTVEVAGKSASVRADAQSHEEPGEEPGAISPKVEVTAELDDGSVEVELGG